MTANILVPMLTTAKTSYCSKTAKVTWALLWTVTGMEKYIIFKLSFKFEYE